MQVTSLKEAIILSLEKFGYDINNREIVEKIINSALDGSAKRFTRHNGAYDYVIKQGTEKIKQELQKYSNSKDINIIIDDYISNAFKEKEINANLDRVLKVIKSINLNVENDEKLKNEVWNYFINVFENKNENFTKEELKFDMIATSLEVADMERGYAKVLSTPSLDSKDLTRNDVINLVEKYVYENKIDILLEAIDKNPYLSGQLLTVMLDHIYFDKEYKKNNNMSLIDSCLKEINLNNKQKALILKEKLNDSYNFIISYDKNIANKLEKIDNNLLIIEMIKNSVYLNLYSSKHKGIDYEERKLYTGENNVETQNVEKIIERNNTILYPFFEKEMNINIDDIYNIINNLNKNDIHFMCDLFVRSRSKEDNIIILNQIPNQINDYNKTYLLGILEDNNLLNKFNSETKKIV